jgi:hypothetical protein
MAFSDKIISFCNKYHISILDDSKRCAKLTSPRYLLNENYSEQEYMQNIASYDTEPLLVIQIPLSKIEHIIEQEQLFFNNISEVYQRRMFEEWLEDRQNEKFICNTHPGVKEAYEKYKMMLALCNNKPNNIKDI